MLSDNMPGDKVPIRGLGAGLSKDSQKSTVKIVQLEKPKSPLLGVSSETKIMIVEFNIFKEEMKALTQNVSTNLSVNANINVLDINFSAMVAEYITDPQILGAEVNTAKGYRTDMTDRMTALETSMDSSWLATERK